MTKSEIEALLAEVYQNTSGNIADEKAATEDPRLAGLRIYDAPLLGIADAEDPLFESYKQPGVVGPSYLAPRDWLPEAQSVISFFLPFSAEVKNANAAQCRYAALEWAYGRIEGQAFLAACCAALAERLRAQGIAVCIPLLDERFAADMSSFTSNWSERHAAFAAGLGTFGKSRGLITKKGMAGRFGSLIISEKIPADLRPYTDIYEYCIDCGACARRCPAEAIPRDGIKDHTKCAPVVAQSKTLLAPRYGCGLCQTGVPCESGIPKR